MTGPMHVNYQAEHEVAAAVLMLGERVVDAILDRVRQADFDDLRCREIMEISEQLRAEGVDPTPTTVGAAAGERGSLDKLGGTVGLDALTARVPSAGALRHTCDEIAKLAMWRRRHKATAALQHAATVAEPDGWDEAERMLHEADQPRRRAGWTEPHAVAERLIDSLDGGDPVRWPWPLRRLNQLAGGGARRGQMTFIGGASSHGKSAFVDCTLQTMGRAGARVGLFLNEMTVEERAERIAANVAKVRYSKIQQASAGLAKLTADESRAIVQAMADQPVGMVQCAGWPVEQIVREARRRHLDVMCLDIVQKLPFQPGLKRVQVLEDAVQRLDALAKDTGCHVILVGQINRERANGTFPVPGLADIKDCAELGNGPDNVLFVWREQDTQTLDPLDTGVIRMAKYRGAQLETIPATFVGDYQRWDERLLVYGESPVAA